MDFKLVSKNNIGAAATLILVIMLTQSRMFDFLMDTTLGRAMLVLFILGISCINKIFGVVAILFIIIMFNNSNLGFMEGFTDTSDNQVTASTAANIPDVKKNIKKNELKEKISDKIAQQQSAATTSTTATTEKFSGREGFNIIDREGSMLKGKSSNSIPVFSNNRVQNDNIEPSDSSSFSGAYAAV